MSILIAYASKYGCTEKCAGILSKKLNEKAELCNLKACKTVDLKQYDKIIIGGSIYAGRIQKEVTQFCSNNMDILKSKKLGFFICGMQEGDAAQKEINASFPEELMSRAFIRECFGGEFKFSKMNMMERFIVKKIAKTDKDLSNIIESNIEKFAQATNNA